MNREKAILVEGLSKKYIIGKQKDGSLRGSLANLFDRTKNDSEDFWALKDVSFGIDKGDVVGVIGKNGAGKSTLLKVLSEITKPTKGRVEINGRVSSLLEVGTGFHPELTGRENIYLNGTILGMTRKEVKSKFEEIVAFSGVEKFIDTPVKHYSSGMYVRLAFSVSAHLEPEILIIDEVLAVGDADFQKKCLGKMQDASKNGRTVLFVSHHLGSIKQLCNKGILLEAGSVKKSGEIDDVITAYQRTIISLVKYVNTTSSKDYYINEAYIDSMSSEFYNSEAIKFIFKVKSVVKFGEKKFILIRIVDEMDQIIGSAETNIKDGKSEYSFILANNILTKGRYKLNVIIYHPAVVQYDNVAECCHFEILDNNEQFAHLETFNIGNVYFPQTWL